jgi:hypothetical protein
VLTGHKAAALALADGPPAEIRYILFDPRLLAGRRAEVTNATVSGARAQMSLYRSARHLDLQ